MLDSRRREKERRKTKVFTTFFFLLIYFLLWGYIEKGLNDVEMLMVSLIQILFLCVLSGQLWFQATLPVSVFDSRSFRCYSESPKQYVLAAIALLDVTCAQFQRKTVIIIRAKIKANSTAVVLKPYFVTKLEVSLRFSLWNYVCHAVMRKLWHCKWERYVTIRNKERYEKKHQ